MQQIKIFKGVEAEVSMLENDVNEWLRESNVRVLNITGNIAPQSGAASDSGTHRFAPSDVLLIVLYETGS